MAGRSERAVSTARTRHAALPEGARALESLSAYEVALLLHTLELGRYADGFMAMPVRGADLDGATEDDLEEAGMSVALHRRALLAQVADYRVHGISGHYLEQAAADAEAHHAQQQQGHGHHHAAQQQQQQQQSCGYDHHDHHQAYAGQHYGGGYDQYVDGAAGYGEDAYGYTLDGTTQAAYAAHAAYEAEPHQQEAAGAVAASGADIGLGFGFDARAGRDAAATDDADDDDDGNDGDDDDDDVNAGAVTAVKSPPRLPPRTTAKQQTPERAPTTPTASAEGVVLAMAEAAVAAESRQAEPDQLLPMRDELGSSLQQEAQLAWLREAEVRSLSPQPSSTELAAPPKEEEPQCVQPRGFWENLSLGLKGVLAMKPSAALCACTTARRPRGLSEMYLNRDRDGVDTAPTGAVTPDKIITPVIINAAVSVC